MHEISKFENRTDAGNQLFESLPPTDPSSTVVVALPRGGVPVGAAIARRIGCPLEVTLVRKIGVPGQDELALGAVTINGGHHIALNEEIMIGLGLKSHDIEGLTATKLQELKELRRFYFGDRKPIPLRGKTVVVVDDGVATGATMEAALMSIQKEEPSKIILALPVAPSTTINKLRPMADHVVCLMQPGHFLSVGSYYDDFNQVDNDEVVALLETHSPT
jgi:putative phosphoribosyl transferase